jgi:hypothetical protein
LSNHTRVITALVAILAAAFSAAAYAGAAAPAAASAQSYQVKATLNTKQQVPAPRNAVGAKGTLTAKLVVAGKNSSFVFRLTFTGLSGNAVAANLRYGAPGKTGSLAMPLCTRCVSNAQGTYKGPYVATPTFLKAILHGGMYVTVLTKKNPKGEIRGQIKTASA